MPIAEETHRVRWLPDVINGLRPTVLVSKALTVAMRCQPLKDVVEHGLIVFRR
jgi:hypothetical protein